MNRRFWTTWPFLCLLACLFVLSVTAPRAWQRAGKARSALPQAATSSSWNMELSEPEPARQSESVALSPVTGSALLTDSTAALAQGQLPEEERPYQQESPHQQETQRLMAFATAPVGTTTAASMVSTSPDPMTIEENPQDLTTEQPAFPASESLVKPLPAISEEIVVESSAETAPAESFEAVWPKPQALFDRLEVLGADGEIGRWAREVSEQLDKLGPAVAANSDEAPMIIERLNELARDANRVAADLERQADPLLGKLRRTQHALGRRLDVWRRVLVAGGPGHQVPSQLNSRRLASCLIQINAMLGQSDAGRPWREYLKLTALQQLANQSADNDDARRVGQSVLKRLSQSDLTAQQREFLATKPMAELAATLEDWLHGVEDLAAVLRHVEGVEQSGRTSDGRLLANDWQRLALSPVPAHRELAERLDLHYRNANIRVAITEDLLNRLMPSREPEFRYVNEHVLGRPVHGQSVTSTDVAVKLIPDNQRLRLALEIKGLVSALTASTAGPATFYNDSQSTYVARKEIELTTQGLKLWPAQVGVNNDLYLQGLRTSLDPIPLVGSLVQEVARSQHEQNRPAMSREVEQKVATRAKQQIDNEADARLSRVSERLKNRFVEPFAAMSLGPTMISAQTDETRMTMRMRFASDEQVSGWTPRPQALTDSLLSVQLHESALNNIVEQMDLDGGAFTVAQLRQRIAQRFNRPEMLQTESSNDDVVIRFAEKDAVRVECQDGCLKVSLSIVSLSRSPHRWKNFQVRAFYRPELIDGRTLQLTRDGVVRLTGERLNTSAQIALRGIFSKTFSKEHPWTLTPEAFLNNPRVAKVGVTQFVIEDGWVGMALGPINPNSQPVIARRPEKKDAE